MKKKPLKIITLVSASFIATSCSIFSNLTYNWIDATNNNTEIRYCLLIGQNEHSDSIERTRWTRAALDTRDEATEINGNANLGTPKEGTITLGKNTSYEKEFKVTEVEHMEQKSLAGVVWDEITANNTTATWINKHGKKMTMLISNNDGMAEGAMHAYNYTKGLPLFGYDANTSTMKLIKQCKETGVGIMGTVDQVAAAQTAATYMIIRNILDDQASGQHNIGTTAYNPTNRGFNHDEYNKDLGLYIDGYNTGANRHTGIVNPNDPNIERSANNLDLSKTDGYHEILSTSEAIGVRNSGGVSDVDNFLNDKGEVKSADELAWDDKLGYVHKRDYKAPTKTYEVCHVYNNVAETYLQGTMQNYYNQYKEAFGINDVKIDGDGISEQRIFDQLDPYASKKTFDAFLINMVTTTDGGTFVTHLAELAANKEGKDYSKTGWDNWEDRLDTPLIFWNKQPQKVTGEVDTDTMNNKYFKYTYFVGVDAAYGGKRQGALIVDYLNYCYAASLKGAK